MNTAILWNKLEETIMPTNKIETKMKPDEIKPVNLLLFVATFFSNVNAQDFKLGKVSFAELQEKFHPRFCCSSSDTI
jgi:hypothetical protein